MTDVSNVSKLAPTHPVINNIHETQPIHWHSDKILYGRPPSNFRYFRWRKSYRIRKINSMKSWLVFVFSNGFDILFNKRILVILKDLCKCSCFWQNVFFFYCLNWIMHIMKVSFMTAKWKICFEVFLFQSRLTFTFHTNECIWITKLNKLNIL